MNKLFDINYIDTNVLVVDKETVIKTNEVGTNGYVLEYFRDRWQEKDWFKVIASTVKIEGVPLIKLEDDFESIHSLAFNEAFKFNKLSGVSILDLIPMYIKGYKEAKCKQYSEEDIRAAIDFGKSIRSEKSHINENFGS
ncbi:MAG: hypothetical protein ABIP51_21530, partial [Bacteroidia bacterium]